MPFENMAVFALARAEEVGRIHHGATGWRRISEEVLLERSLFLLGANA